MVPAAILKTDILILRLALDIDYINKKLIRCLSCAI